MALHHSHGREGPGIGGHRATLDAAMDPAGALATEARTAAADGSSREIGTVCPPANPPTTNGHSP